MNIIDFIDYDHNYEDFLQELDLNNANSKYPEKIEEVYVEDASYDYRHSLAIVRPKKEELSTTNDDSSSKYHFLPDPINSRSRRIMKREKATQRNQIYPCESFEDEPLLKGIPLKFLPDEVSKSNLDEKSKKKMLQMIRNRISAQNSRDRRKNLIDSLEAQTKLLTDENLQLKQRVTELEDFNCSLQQELLKYKNIVVNVNSIGSNHVAVSCNKFSEDRVFNPFDPQSSIPSTESPELSGNSSPIVRRSLRSGGFMKFSLALVTIFAVAMFTGSNLSEMVAQNSNNQMFREPVRILAVNQNETNNESAIPDNYNNYDFDFDTNPTSSSLVSVKTKANSFVNYPHVHANLEEHTFVNEISTLQQNFGDMYMDRFSKKLQIVHSNYFSATRNLSLESVQYSTYLKSGKNTITDIPNYRNFNATSTTVVSLTGSAQVPVMREDNFSSLFCPTGYELEGKLNDSFVKGESEEREIKTEKKLKLIDSEWLQLFVPKENISLANFVNMEEIMVQPSESETVEDGPIVEDKPLMDIDKYIETLKTCKPLSERDMKLVCDRVIEILSEESNVQPVNAPVNICGDIHGQFYDLLELFSVGGEIPKKKYIFIGDLVDRGYHSVETLSLLFCYKIKYTDSITILRGNHESRQISRQYGFYEEIKRKYGNSNVWNYCTAAFDYLPIAALVEGRILCLHGGLSPSASSLDKIRALDRVTEIPLEGTFTDLMWSDPDKIDAWSINEGSGAGWLFGSKVTKEFNHLNMLELICRAHQLVQEGYIYWFKEKSLVTVWSAPNYCYRCGNDAAILELDENLQRNWKIFYSDPESVNSKHPKTLLPYFL